MTRGGGLWSKFKKTVCTEVQDDEKLAANLAKQDLCVTIRELVKGELPPGDFARGLRGSLKGSLKGNYFVKVGSERLSDLTDALARFGRDIVERVTDERLVRSAALFVGSVVVMRNFGDLMAV